MCQGLCKPSPERPEAAKDEVQKLLKTSIIREVIHSEWLSNPILVKKHWRMCIDFTSLNKAYPRDPYALPRLDQLVDSTAGCNLLSFLDTYSEYH